MKFIPTYEIAVEMTKMIDSPFYESKTIIDGYQISTFNYRLAQWSDFNLPGAKEMRGLTFVFNLDGSFYKRFILLEKFFNLNQVPESMYSIVKNHSIKSISNKEDGSITSFVSLPNGKILGKSKMSFDNEQTIGMMRIYNSNKYLRDFIKMTIERDITAVFEYVSIQNRIVLKYLKEELILLQLRDNITGELLDINMFNTDDIKVTNFENDNTLDELIEKSKYVEEKEGWVIQFENGSLIKIKCNWYCERHGILTEDLYRENILIGYVLDDKIDDILGQIPEDQVEAHDRIGKIVSVVKKSITKKVLDIEKSHQVFVDMGSVHKDYALIYRKNKNFGYVMALSRGSDIHELAKDYIREKTKRLLIARDFLVERDSSIFFQDPDLNEDDN